MRRSGLPFVASCYNVVLQRPFGPRREPGTMSDSRVSDPLRPSADALLHAARQEARGRFEDFPWRRAGCRQDLRDAAGGRRPPQGRRWMSSSGSWKPTAARRRRPWSQGLEIIPRRVRDHQGHVLRKWISMPCSGGGPPWSSSTSWPIPTPRAAATRSATWTSRNSSPAGIDVFSTLNIQHVESLNDVVAQITGIRVRETVPGRDHRAGRRYRGDRHHASGPDPDD